MTRYTGKWALVTGASSGIGEVFAQKLAQAGANLILVARREERLQKLAERLRLEHGIKTEVIAQDLSDPLAPQKIFDALAQKDINVHTLVNNAGFGLYGRLDQTDLARNQQQIMVNVYALSSLTQLFLPGMVAAKDGVVVNVASTASFQPVPYMSNYGASKAFVRSFTLALWAEYRSFGIRFLALCPGPVETEFFDIAGPEAAVGAKDTSENVVARALRAVEQDRCYVVPGPCKTWLLSELPRLLPQGFMAKLVESIMRKK